MKQMFARTEREFAQLPARLPERPRAVLVITGHWEAPQFSVSTAQLPPMEYDYSGFPEHTYRLKYPAPGLPELAQRVHDLLGQHGIASASHPERGFDPGTVVLLSLMYPAADVPAVLLSLKDSYDAAVRTGEAIAALRDQGVLILGSGLTYHNMAGFGRRASGLVAGFRGLPGDAVRQDPTTRNRMLIEWQTAPGAAARASAGGPPPSADGGGRCCWRRHRRRRVRHNVLEVRWHRTSSLLRAGCPEAVSFVVTESCIRCKYADRVAVCPMNCFIEGPQMLMIDPEGCMDCAMCVLERPVDAIAHESELAPAQAEFAALNARLARTAGWPLITRRKSPPADHAAWVGVAGKRSLLEG